MPVSGIWSTTLGPPSWPLSNVVLEDTQEVLVSVGGPTGNRRDVQALVRRQLPGRSGGVAVGVEYVSVDDKALQALIGLLFGDAKVWSRPGADVSIWRNM